MVTIHHVLKSLMLSSLIAISAFSQVTFQHLGLVHKEVISISLYEDVIVAGTEYSGVYWKSLQSLPDTSWNFIGLDTLLVQTIYINKTGPSGWMIYVGAQPDVPGSSYIYSSLNGNPFFPVSQGIQDTFTTGIRELDGFFEGETYAAGNRALYRLIPGDTAWAPVYTATIEGDIGTVRTHDEYPGIVLAGGGDGFANHLLVKSYNYGNTWENISPLQYIKDVDFAGDSAQTIFAVGSQNVFRSTEAGISWETVFGSLNLTKVIFLPPSTVLLAGENSFGWAVILYSEDLGDNWEQILPQGMGGPIIDMEFYDDGWIYFAHRIGGVFRFQQESLSISETGSFNQLANFRLFQNYPNPFNPSTNIGFRIWDFGFVSLEVFDVTGRKVATLVHKELLPGEYEVQWDGRDDAGREVSSGIYIYQLRAGDFTQSRKMLLIR